MTVTRVLGKFSALILASTLVAGCAAAESPDLSPIPTPPSATAPREFPAFEGAWSDLFTTVYASPNATEEQRAVLADGVITDAEYAQLRGAFAQCLKDLGLTSEIHPGGGFTVEESGGLSESQISGDAVPRCEQRTVGSVALLYEQIRRNPEQKDEASIVVECLKRNEVVGASYTPAEYRRDLDAYAGLEWDSNPVRTCTQDPLGILEGASAPPRG